VLVDAVLEERPVRARIDDGRAEIGQYADRGIDAGTGAIELSTGLRS
jgi:hypothetical protein